MDIKQETLSDIIPPADKEVLANFYDTASYKIFHKWFLTEHRIHLTKALYLDDDQRRNDRVRGKIDLLTEFHNEMKKIYKEQGSDKDKKTIKKQEKKINNG